MKIRYARRGTFYFFPAFLPLAELLPWVLSLLGAVAGVAGFSPMRFLRKHRALILGVTILCFSGAAGVYFYYRPNKAVRYEGTELLDPAKFPPAQILGKAQPQDAASYDKFQKIWTVTTDKQILSTPVIDGDLLIYGAYNSATEALSLKDGSLVWDLPQRAAVFALSVAGQGRIFSSEGLHDTQSAALTAIDSANGGVAWKRDFLGHLEETVSFNEDKSRLWISAGPGGLWCIKTADGSVVWHAAIGHADSEALVTRRAVYIPAQPDEAKKETALFALDARNGHVLWQVKQPGQPWGSPVLDKGGDIIYTTTGLGQIGVARGDDAGWAMAVSTKGKTLWQVTMPGMAIQPSIYMPAQDVIVHSLKSGELAALNTKDGSIAWCAAAGGELQSPGTLIEGFKVPMIAAVTYDGLLSIFRATDGILLTRVKVGRQSTSSPVVKGDVLYVSSAYELSAFGGLHMLAEMN